MMKFICYPKCTTCKKAQAFLDSLNVQYELVDIKQNNPEFEQLKKWVQKSGLDIKKFFNTSGLLYKAMGLKDKLNTMTDDEKLALLASDGMLIKRPLLIADSFVLVGFKQAQWEEHLKNI